MNKLLLQKQMVGYYIENIPVDCNKKIIYVLQGDGLWQVRKNRIGTFNIKIAEAVVPGLEKNMKEGRELSVPKIPFGLWKIVLAFFKDIQKVQDTEAYLQFFYDSNAEEYILYCPEQKVSKASINYKTSPEFEADNMICVLEIHSHGTMSAFFSGTDNADEKSDRFFGVVGKIDSFFPEVKFRLMLGGKELPVSFNEIFEEEVEADYPTEWLGRIKKESKKGKSKLQIDMFEEEEVEDEWVNYIGTKEYYGGKDFKHFSKFFDDEGV